MGQGGDILNGLDSQSRGLESGNGRFTSGAGALDSNLDFHNAILLGCGGTTLGSPLGGKRRTLTGTFETDSTGGIPTYSVALCVGYSDSGVVKGGIDVSNAPGDRSA